MSQNEKFIDLKSVPDTVYKLAPHLGKICYHTAFRWMTRGAHGHVLQSVKMLGKRYTTKPWVAEFLQATQEPGAAVKANAAKVQRRRNASRKLNRMGA